MRKFKPLTKKLPSSQHHLKIPEILQEIQQYDLTPNKLMEFCPICFERFNNKSNQLPRFPLPKGAPTVQILICKVCKLSVHNYCYGIKTPCTPFICEICQYNENYHPKCLICGNDDCFNRAFKRVDRNAWVHVLCGLTSYRTLIIDFRTMKFKLMPEETLKPKGNYEKCYICGMFCQSKDLWKCDLCPVKAHLICICIEKVFTESNLDLWWFLWFKFSAYAAPYERISLISEELFIEECESLKGKFFTALTIYDHDNCQIQPKEHNILDFLHLLQNKLYSDLVKPVDMPNHGFHCKDHHMTISCNCGNIHELDDEIWCEYCNNWFHVNCLEKTFDNQNSLCGDCKSLHFILPTFYEILMTNEASLITNLKDHLLKLSEKNLRLFELMILAVLNEDLLERMSPNQIGIEGFMKVLSEIFLKFPINLGVRLMTPMQNYLKRSYWEEFLLEECLDLNALVKTCLNDKKEFDEEGHKNLQKLLTELKYIEGETLGLTGDEREFDNKKLKDLQEICNTQNIVRTIINGNEISNEDFEILKDISKKFPFIQDFSLMVDTIAENHKVAEELKLILTHMNNDYQDVKMMNINEINDLLNMDSLIVKQWTEPQAKEIIDKLMKYKNYNKELSRIASIETFANRLDNEMQELLNIKEIVNFSSQEHFNMIIKQVTGFIVFNENSRVLCDLAKKWRRWQRNYMEFDRIQKEISIAPLIWKNKSSVEFDFNLIDENPLLFLSQTINLDKEPFFCSKSLYDILSKKNVKELLEEASEMQYKLPFMQPDCQLLRNLLDESNYLESILDKVYNFNTLEIRLKNLFERLSAVNLFFPIFDKIQCFGLKTKEIMILKNSANYLLKTIGKIETLMLKTCNLHCLLDLTELKKGVRLEKRLKRILGCHSFEKQKSYLLFLSEIQENFHLYKNLDNFLKNLQKNFLIDSSTLFQFIEEKLDLILNDSEMFQEFDSNIEEAIESHNNKTIEKSFFTSFLSHYQEIDSKPELKILLKGLREVLFELRWIYWSYKLKKLTLHQNKLNLEDFRELQEYLTRFIESLGIQMLVERSQYKFFKSLEKSFSDWWTEYQEILRLLMEKQQQAKTQLEDLHQRLGVLRSSLPLSINSLENKINNLSLGLHAALKAKKTLYLMAYERKVLAFSCIESLYEFFQSQTPHCILPFANELIAKYQEIKALKIKYENIQGFIRNKAERFKNFTLKGSNLKAIKILSSDIKALYLIKHTQFLLNFSGIYEYFDEIFDYKELLSLIELIKASGVDFKNEKRFLQEIKKTCDNFIRTLDYFFGKLAFPSISINWSADLLDEYFFSIMNLRNGLFSAHLIRFHQFNIFRHFEWSFYTISTLSGNFWLLKETANPFKIIEKIKFLKAFELNLKEIDSITAFNDLYEMQRLLTEGLKNKAMNTFTKEALQVYEMLEKEIYRYEQWVKGEFNIFKHKYDNIELIIEKNTNLNNIIYENELKTIVSGFLTGKIFESSLLKFLCKRVREYKESLSFWQGLKEMKEFPRISEEMIKGLIWVKFVDSDSNIQLFKRLVKVLHMIKGKYSSFLKKTTSEKFSRLMKLYKFSGFYISSIERLKEENMKNLQEMDELYQDFQDHMKLENSLEVWLRLCLLKKKLKDEIQHKFVSKYQSFWLEILESQILCLKSICGKKPIIKGLSSYNETNNNNNANSINTLGPLDGNYAMDKIKISIAELKEIQKESQGLSKPSRDFLEDFLRKCYNMKAILKKTPWMKNILDYDEINETVNVNMKTKLIEFKRIRNIYRICEVLEKMNKFSKKKLHHLAEFIENQAFKRNREKTAYQKYIEEIFSKLQLCDDGDIIKTLDIKVMMRDNEMLEWLKKGLDEFLKVKV